VKIPSRLVRPGLLVPLILFAALLFATRFAVTTHATLESSSGFRARYWRGQTAGQGTLLLEALDPRGPREALERRGRAFRDEPFTVEWIGHLIVAAERSFRFALPANGAASFEIDRQLVARSDMPTGSRPLRLSRGVHPIRIVYTSVGQAPSLDFWWAPEGRAFDDVPALLVIPEPRYPEEIRARGWTWRFGQTLPLIWLVLVIGCTGIFAMRGVGSLRGHALLFVVAGCLFGVGIGWGAPDQTWVPDELTPGDIQFAVQYRFSQGWATIYPPLHFVLLALCYVPFHLGSNAGLIDLFDADTQFNMIIAARLVSLGMALGILALTRSIAAEHFGERAGWFAPAILLGALPLTYYAKTANLDVPYVFWLTVALRFYLRAYRHGRPRDYYLFVLSGIAAICTKDQAFGFFILPAVFMVGGALVAHFRGVSIPGVPPLGVVLRMVPLTLVAAILGYNMVWNWSGFQDHLRAIAGPASEGYRMYERTLAQFARMWWDVFVQVGRLMSWPLFLALLCACAVAVRRMAISRFLLLPALSYCLCFISVVMYHYDRFFLGVAVILAILGGWAFDRWTRAGVPLRWARFGLVGACLVYAIARAAALDATMLRDSRYRIESAVVEAAGSRDTIAAAGMYVPRRSVLRWARLTADTAAIEGLKPKYVIVNAAFSRREPLGSPQGEFYAALSAGRIGYDLAFQRGRDPAFPLSLERRFTRVDEDQFSNLTKINPLIEVYVRRE
jgi:4-amino-4-deoxy-L-arabinose transferase-like glycosyltransferase